MQGRVRDSVAGTGVSPVPCSDEDDNVAQNALS